MNPLLAPPSRPATTGGSQRAHTRVGIRDLKQNASRVIADLESDHEVRIITVNGRPAAGLVPLDTLEREVTAHSVERIGLRSDDFRARLAAFPATRLGVDEQEVWRKEVDEANAPETVADPWEAAGR